MHFNHTLPNQLYSNPFGKNLLGMKLLTFLELFGRVVLGHVGEEHPPEQGVGAGDLLLADPVIHDAQVGVVGGQEPQQGRVQPLGTSGTFTAQI